MWLQGKGGGNRRFKLIEMLNIYFLGKVIVWFVQLNDSEEYLPGQLLKCAYVCKTLYVIFAITV